jgi:hypothetical protein
MSPDDGLQPPVRKITRESLDLPDISGDDHVSERSTAAPGQEDLSLEPQTDREALEGQG